MVEVLNTLTLPTRYGVLTVPADDLVIGRSLATYGEWAQREIEFLLHFIKAGDTVLDVGACFGTHSLAFSERVGQAGRVLAFEASPKNFPLLEKNCQTRRGGRIKPIQAVVAQADSLEFRFRNDDQNRGGSSFDAVASADACEGSDAITVKSRSIDGLALDRVDFIKIDVEGMEWEVIAGALATIQRCAPYIFFEVNFIEEGRRTIELLRGGDYLFFGLLCDPFNPDNFYGAVQRIFGEGRECGVLAVAKARHHEVEEIILAHRLAAIETADDLALLLMNKPQYVRSDITRERAARTLRVPAIVANACGAEQTRQELAELRESKPVFERELTALSDRNRNLDGELHRLRADLLARDRESDALSKLNRTFENELNLLRAANGAVEQELVTLKGVGSQLERELLLLRQEKADRDREFTALHATHQKTEQELQFSREEKSSLDQECVALKSSASILEGELHQARDWNSALEQDLQLLRDAKACLEQECVALNSSSAKLEDDFRRARDGNSALERDLQLSRGETSSLERERAALKSSIGNLEDDLTQLRDWKRALERKLESLDKMNRVSHDALEAALAERREELDAAINAKERCDVEIERLGSLIVMAKKLARRADTFPFVLYFGRKRKYKSILGALQSASVPRETQEAGAGLPEG